MDPREHLRSYLRDNGLSFTRARAAILDGIRRSAGHFDAEALRDTLRGGGVTMSTATIYRALPLFVKSGIIRETLRAGGRAHYEPTWGRDHHDHLECIRCGRIIEFKDDELERLQDRICRKRGFTPVEHRLGIRGYCGSCRK